MSASQNDKAMSVRDIRAAHIGKLIRMRGIVIRATEVKPHASVITYTCDTCANETYQPVGSVALLLAETLASPGERALVYACAQVSVEGLSELTGEWPPHDASAWQQVREIPGVAHSRACENSLFLGPMTMLLSVVGSSTYRQYTARDQCVRTR